jgi:hypothetical protein
MMRRCLVSMAANLPSTMQAAVLRGNQTLAIETLNLPVPKAGEVLVKTRACGVCHTDLHIVKEEFPSPKPVVLGTPRWPVRSARNTPCGVVFHE